MLCLWWENLTLGSLRQHRRRLAFEARDAKATAINKID